MIAHRSRRHGFSMIELVFGLLLTAMITAAVGLVGQKVLESSDRRSRAMTLQSLGVEVERVRELSGGVVAQQFVPLLHPVSGVTVTDAVSGSSSEVSAASDGAGFVALAVRDGDGCLFLLLSASASTYARDGASASCSAQSLLPVAQSVTGSMDAPSDIDVG